MVVVLYALLLCDISHMFAYIFKFTFEGRIRILMSNGSIQFNVKL